LNIELNPTKARQHGALSFPSPNASVQRTGLRW
jgi:hypothetical protein